MKIGKYRATAEGIFKIDNVSNWDIGRYEFNVKEKLSTNLDYSVCDYENNIIINVVDGENKNDENELENDLDNEKEENNEQNFNEIENETISPILNSQSNFQAVRASDSGYIHLKNVMKGNAIDSNIYVHYTVTLQISPGTNGTIEGQDSVVEFNGEQIYPATGFYSRNDSSINLDIYLKAGQEAYIRYGEGMPHIGYNFSIYIDNSNLTGYSVSGNSIPRGYVSGLIITGENIALFELVKNIAPSTGIKVQNNINSIFISLIALSISLLFCKILLNGYYKYNNIKYKN